MNAASRLLAKSDLPATTTGELVEVILRLLTLHDIPEEGRSDKRQVIRYLRTLDLPTYTLEVLL